MTSPAIWTEEYWDIQRRAFWGIRRYFARRITPLCSHCASQKPDASKHSSACFEKKLRKEEVFLNDILNLLMGLAPQALYRRIIKTAFATVVPAYETFQSLGTNYLKHFDVGASTTQPDFLALGTEHTFAIELKLTTKSHLKQVLLYAALAALEDLNSGTEKTHFLLMLTPPRRFNQIWKEGFDEPSTFRAELEKAAVQPGSLTAKQASLFEKVNLPAVLPRFFVAHLNYLQFADALERCRPKQQSDADETLEKLLTGAASEFRSFCAAT